MAQRRTFPSYTQWRAPEPTDYTSQRKAGALELRERVHPPWQFRLTCGCPNASWSEGSDRQGPATRSFYAFASAGRSQATLLLSWTIFSALLSQSCTGSALIKVLHLIFDSKEVLDSVRDQKKKVNSKSTAHFLIHKEIYVMKTKHINTC